MSKSFNHIPSFLDPVLVYEEDNCWNCGGELLIEYPSGETAFETEVCPMCGGTGYLMSGVMPNNLFEWVIDRPRQPVIYSLPDAEINWKPPQ